MNENPIKKKKSPLPVIIIAVVVAIICAVVYFMFFTQAAKDAREIKLHLANAEKYLDDADYEKAIAEYEAALKLDPENKDILDDYVDTVLAYADFLSEDDPEEAADILRNAAEFLNKISDGDKDIDSQSEKLSETADEYQAEADDNQTKEETSDSADIPTAEIDAEDESDDGEKSDILLYEQDGYIIFGVYEQDGDLTNGPEPIEWEVLGSDQNGTLLISRYILDCQPYNTEFENVTWELCSLREWLNDDFLNSAFTPDEQVIINTTTLVNSDNSYQGSKGGDNTEDKIFCLSVDEVLDHYTFNTYYDDLYYGLSQPLFISATQYAKDMGVYTEVYEGVDFDWLVSDYGYTTDCVGREGGSWWLRSPGYSGDSACFVDYFGMAGAGLSDQVVCDEFGVRPALYIND